MKAFHPYCADVTNQKIYLSFEKKCFFVLFVSTGQISVCLAGNQSHAAIYSFRPLVQAGPDLSSLSSSGLTGWLLGGCLCGLPPTGFHHRWASNKKRCTLFPNPRRECEDSTTIKTVLTKVTWWKKWYVNKTNNKMMRQFTGFNGILISYLCCRWLLILLMYVLSIYVFK